MQGTVKKLYLVIIILLLHACCTYKISDFGMSCDLADETYYVFHGGMIPVKWTAPEAIHYKKYSTASVICNYGCLLYEIWSLGWKPFDGTENIEVMLLWRALAQLLRSWPGCTKLENKLTIKVVRLIDSKKRLPPPSGCSRSILV